MESFELSEDTDTTWASQSRLTCLKDKEESRESQYTPKRNKCSARHRHTLLATTFCPGNTQLKTIMWLSEGHVKPFRGFTISSRFSIPQHDAEAVRVGYLEQCQGTPPAAAPYQSWNLTVLTRLVQGRTPGLEGSSRLSHWALPAPSYHSPAHSSPRV